jgi:hypothetical protein
LGRRHIFEPLASDETKLIVPGLAEAASEGFGKETVKEDTFTLTESESFAA